MRDNEVVNVGPEPLTFDDVIRVARHGAPVRLTDDAVAAVSAARQRVDDLAEAPVPAYGISTGFGALATRPIDPSLRAQPQRPPVRPHAAGTGLGRRS